MVQSLDPFFTSGADDGRGQYAQQVSNWMQAQIFSMFPAGGTMTGIGGTKLNMGGMLGFLQQQMLAWLGKFLGPNPTLEDWQQLWTRLSSGPSYKRPVPTPVPGGQAGAAPTGTTPMPPAPPQAVMQF